MEWISVKDKLPEQFESVNVAIESGIVAEGFVDGFVDGLRKWHFYDAALYPYYPVKEDNQVTHWMPLPEPPKQD